MKEFIISTDSTVDLPQEYLKENNISIHPLFYIIDGEEYIPGVSDMPVEEFYNSMKNGNMPTTSASNPKYIMEDMKKHINEGYDILHISFSSGLSSSYNNASICAQDIMEEIPGSKIIVIDSLCVTVGQGILVYKAVEMKKQGKTIEEIAEWIKENNKHVIQECIVDDLFHLVRGGRLSKSTAIVGTMLRIQPMIHVDDDGKLSVIGKVRGRKKALNTLADNIEEKIKDSRIDMAFIAHGNCIEDAEYLAEQIKNKYNVKNVMINDLCPTIGAHTGQGAVVAAYFGNER